MNLRTACTIKDQINNVDLIFDSTSSPQIHFDYTSIRTLSTTIDKRTKTRTDGVEIRGT